MTTKIKAAIIGYGNIGHAVHAALALEPDFTLTGIVASRNASKRQGELFLGSIDEMTDVDVAILAAPSRAVPELTKTLLQRGIRCVDAYDIHSNIVEYRAEADALAKAHGAVSIVAAGWDPGSDSVIRALLLAMAPQGISFTDFGPGMSMGHSVCARGKEGVKDALSMTMPLGDGIHRRMVYVELQEGAQLDAVADSIRTDPYFAHDETHVIPVPSVAALRDMGHGVKLSRKGVSGGTHNQLFSFDMRINNPALTAQVMVSCARAATRLSPGAYTMIEIPPIDLLPGDRNTLIHDLV